MEFLLRKSATYTYYIICVFNIELLRENFSRDLTT